MHLSFEQKYPYRGWKGGQETFALEGVRKKHTGQQNKGRDKQRAKHDGLSSRQGIVCTLLILLTVINSASIIFEIKASP